MDAKQDWYRNRQPIIVSPGEYFDRWTILSIKVERIQDDAKRAVAREELDQLGAPFGNNPALLGNEEIKLLIQLLRHVNENLWDVEEKLRYLERNNDFGKNFVELARSVYKLNDKRADTKRQIDRHCDQQGEVKELPSY